tara:strand:+ start:946 stop:1083 length:138 start_codon:yes stop_codon:yes gene_type:complete
VVVLVDNNTPVVEEQEDIELLLELLVVEVVLKVYYLYMKVLTQLQ